MPYNQILNNIRRFVILTREQEEDFCSLLSIRKIKRKEFLLREGDVCVAEYFVNSGCLREYYTDQKEVEHNLYFAIEDWWISDLYSRTQLTPTYCNIIALEDSELVEVNHQVMEQFLTKVPAMERFLRLSYERALVNQHLRNLCMLSMTAEERYVDFIARYPKLSGRIPQKHIATFLGLTPEFFNTIHAKVMRSK
jgi:CRP-like cAMP-binding protein